ncbi:hypothetical protein K8R47_00805 [archaeon]|nr:hypothetical protein [archaeon]
MKKKGQASVELMLLMGIGIILVLGFAVAEVFYLDFTTSRKTSVEAQGLVQILKNEINLAAVAENGYTKTITLPSSIDGKDYDVIFNEREVTVTINIDGQQSDWVEVLLTHFDAAQSFDENTGDITITKEDNIVTLT